MNLSNIEYLLFTTHCDIKSISSHGLSLVCQLCNTVKLFIHPYNSLSKLKPLKSVGNDILNNSFIEYIFTLLDSEKGY